MGMVNAVPLKTIVKTGFQCREDLRPIAMILGPVDDDSSLASA